MNRLLLNLSFDADLRAKMVQAGALPKLVELLKDERNQRDVHQSPAVRLEGILTKFCN